MVLSIERVDDFDYTGLEEAWERLALKGARTNVFSSYTWCRAWAQTLGKSTRPMVLLVKDEAGETRGLMPGCIDRVGPACWFKFLGRDRSSGDHLDILCGGRDHLASLSAVLEHIERSHDIDGLVLGELERASPTLVAVSSWARQRGYVCREREHRAVPYVGLPVEFEEYLASLSSNMRYHLRRRRRELDRTSGASLHVLTSESDVDKALTDFFRLHTLRWQARAMPGLYQDAAMQQFLRAFCKRAARRGWVRVYSLAVNREAQCVLIAFHCGNVASFYQMGWDPRSTVKSPGVILMAESIRQAIDEGMRRYDFLRGDEAYKMRWTREAVEQVTLVVGCRAAARAEMAAERVKDGVKQVVEKTLGAEAWTRMRRLVRNH